MKRLLVLQHLEMEGPGLFYQIAKENDMNIEISLVKLMILKSK